MHHHKIRREKWLATASQVGMNESFYTNIGSPNHVRFDPASDRIADIPFGFKRRCNRRSKGGVTVSVSLAVKKTDGKAGRSGGLSRNCKPN